MFTPTKLPISFNKTKTKDTMPYTLVTPTGKEMQFYTLNLALKYQSLEGGEITVKK